MSQSIKKDKVIAVDIGGTKTLIGIVDSYGKVIIQKKFQTDITVSMKDHLAKCFEIVDRCLEETNILPREIKGVGLSLPGITNSKEGRLIHAPYAGWRDFPVKQYVQEVWPDVRVEIENDVNACAVGESLFGKGKDIENYLWVTISTGIGGALVINRQIVLGETMMAGEIGHIKVVWNDGNPCGCGGKGCLEAHASGAAISRKASELISLKGEKLELANYLSKNNLDISTENIAKAANMANKEAILLFEEAGNLLGKAFSYIINIINPGAIIVGGGVSQSFSLLEPHIRSVLSESVIGQHNKNIPLLRTDLGYEAGLIGAASLIFAATKREDETLGI